MANIKLHSLSKQFYLTKELTSKASTRALKTKLVHCNTKRFYSLTRTRMNEKQAARSISGVPKLGYI